MTIAPHPTRRLPLLLSLLAIAALAQWLLVGNPGWFSHDELQWAVRADVGDPNQLPWFPWTDVSQFQWRPLTFNVWMLLSWSLFDTPVAWHLAWVLAGSGLAVTLATLLLRLGATTRVAAAAALVFALCPYAVYVHGWVATLADLLWVGLGLALAHASLTMREQWRTPGAWTAGARFTTAFVAFIVTAVALLAKESALALPALLALTWVLLRERWLGLATLGAGAAAVVYLGLRLPVLLAGDSAGTYAIDVTQVPQQWATYHLYVLRPSTFEVAGLWNASTAALVAAALLWLGLWWQVGRADRRLGVALVVGGALSLAPMLPIKLSSTQYGYGFAAWTVACVALAWPRLPRSGRVLVGLFVVVSLWHGVNVQREMRRAGERQAVFQPALVAALQDHRGPLRLYAPEGDAWLYRRLTTQVPSWHGGAIGDRVRWVDSAEAAHGVVAEDGALVAP